MELLSIQNYPLKICFSEFETYSFVYQADKHFKFQSSSLRITLGKKNTVEFNKFNSFYLLSNLLNIRD